MSVVSEKRDLLIIPCECEWYLGRVTAAAAEELSRRPGVLSLKLQPGADTGLLGREIDDSDRCIAVDGCEEQCISKILKDLNVDCEFHLVLADLGIEELSEVGATTEDIQLAIDGILSESTRVSNIIPRLPGCCC